MAEIDKLEIIIEAEGLKAIAALEKLSASLKSVKDAAKGGLGLRATINQLEKLNEVMSGKMGEPFKDIKKQADMSGVTGPLKQAAQELEHFGQIFEEMQELSRLKDPKKGINELAGAAKELSLIELISPQNLNSLMIFAQLTKEGRSAVAEYAKSFKLMEQAVAESANPLVVLATKINIMAKAFGVGKAAFNFWHH